MKGGLDIRWTIGNTSKDVCGTQFGSSAASSQTIEGAGLGRLRIHGTGKQRRDEGINTEILYEHGRRCRKG